VEGAEARLDELETSACDLSKMRRLEDELPQRKRRPAGGAIRRSHIQSLGDGSPRTGSDDDHTPTVSRSSGSWRLRQITVSANTSLTESSATGRRAQRPGSKGDRTDTINRRIGRLIVRQACSRSREPTPATCFFHASRNFRSLRRCQILVRGQLLLHLAAFWRVESLLDFFARS